VDKRKHLRVSIKLPVSCELDGANVVDGVATNISLGGVRIESSEVPAYGTQLTVVLRVPGEAATSRLPATVRWSAPGCFGVEFGLLGARDTYRIVDLMGRTFRADPAR
jgi:type IV pilus assembly protein PilZ